jgi:hypothetical protein
MHIGVFLADNKIISKFNVPDSTVDMDFVYRQLGKPYSIKQILEIAFKYVTGIKILDNNNNNSFICSELVGKALKLPWVTDLTTPVEVATYLTNIGIK